MSAARFTMNYLVEIGTDSYFNSKTKDYLKLELRLSWNDTRYFSRLVCSSTTFPQSMKDETSRKQHEACRIEKMSLKTGSG